MRAKFWLTALTSLAITAPIGNASALGFSIGDSSLRECYVEAAFGAGTASGVCDLALSSLGLTSTQRAAIYANRSVIRLRALDNAGALSDSEAALALNSRLAEAQVTRGIALLNVDRAADALAAFDKGIAFGSKRLHVAYYNRGIAKEMLLNARGAYYDYKASQDAQPDYALAAAQLARFRVVRNASAPDTSQIVAIAAGAGVIEIPPSAP